MALNLQYHPFYQTYIDKVNLNKTLIENLQDSLNDVFSVLGSISVEKSNYRYADNKWSLKELMQHLIDTERVMSYRALAIAKNDKNNLSGFDENEYITFSDAKNSNFIDLLKEFSLIRKANIAMFKNFSSEMIERIGTANNSKITVKSIGYIMSGHVLHHLNVVKERYL
jgi:hypothetical protein